MSMGKSYHQVSQGRLHARTVENGGPAPVITSAGALIDALHVLKAKRIALVAPYMKPLTQPVVDSLEHEGVRVVDWRALEIPANPAVGRHTAARLPDRVPTMCPRQGARAGPAP